jgi:hypothetical protein
VSVPVHPPHLLYAVWTNNDTGDLVLTNQQGQVFDLGVTEAPHLAAMLAEHCTDNRERGFVRDTWGEIDEDEEDE